MHFWYEGRAVNVLACLHHSGAVLCCAICTAVVLLSSLPLLVSTGLYELSSSAAQRGSGAHSVCSMHRGAATCDQSLLWVGSKAFLPKPLGASSPASITLRLSLVLSLSQSLTVPLWIAVAAGAARRATHQFRSKTPVDWPERAEVGTLSADRSIVTSFSARFSHDRIWQSEAVFTSP